MSRGFRENLSRLTTGSKEQAKFDLDRARHEAMQGKTSDTPIAPHLDQTTLLEKGKNHFLPEKTVQDKATKKEIENIAIRSFIESSTLLERAYICASQFSELQNKFNSSPDKLKMSELAKVLRKADTLLVQTEEPQVLEGNLQVIAQTNNDSAKNAIAEMDRAKDTRKFGTYSETIKKYMDDLNEINARYSTDLQDSKLDEQSRDFREQILDFSEKVSDFMKKKIYDSFFQDHLSETYDLTSGWPDYSLSIEQVRTQHGENMAKAAKDAKDISNDLVSEIIAPEVVRKKPDYDTNLKTIIDGTSEGQKLLIISDFDGTGADFTKHAKDSRTRAAYRRAIETLVEKGHDVAIITGRPIEGEDGILAALRNSGFSQDVIDKLHIYGSHGVEYRTPKTNGRVEVPAEIKPILQTQAQLIEAIEKGIENNPNLTNLRREGKFKSEVKKAGEYTSGATFHFGNITEAQVRQAAEQQFKKMADTLIANSTEFNVFTITETFELRLKKDTAPVQINKGAATEALIKDLEPTNLIGLGDDTTDIDIQTAGKKGVQDNKLVTQIFIGVEHVNGTKTAEKIMNDSDIVMKGPKNMAKHLLDIAKRLPSIKTGESSVPKSKQDEITREA